MADVCSGSELTPVRLREGVLLDQDHRSTPIIASEEAKLKERIKLRFGNSDRLCPPEFIDLAEALDQVGVRMFNERWGWTSIWNRMPFMARRGEFRKYSFDGNDDPQLRSRRVKFLDTDSGDPANCASIYKTLVNEFAAVLIRNEIDSYKMYKDGHVVVLNKDHTGIWAEQKKTIFYTGYASDYNPSKRFRMLLNRRAFEDWFRRPTQRHSFLSPAERQVLLASIAETIAARAQQKAYKPNKKDTCKIVKEVLSIEGAGELSIEQIRLFCWQDQSLAEARKRGHPFARDTRQRLDDEIHLRQCVAHVVRKAISTQTNIE